MSKQLNGIMQVQRVGVTRFSPHIKPKHHNNRMKFSLQFKIIIFKLHLFWLLLFFTEESYMLHKE